MFLTSSFSEVSEMMEEFLPKKRDSVYLSHIYDLIGYESKVKQVSDCGNYLEFHHELDDDGCINEVGLLHRANFCKDRLCPLCSWRRSLKMFGQISDISDHLHDDYLFLFLTLTVPNCRGSTLSKTINDMMKGFRKFIRKKDIKNVVHGFIRSLEITYNISENSFHPHFHVILAVGKNYVSSRNYLSHRDFACLWTSSILGKNWRTYRQRPYVVDIRRCYGSDSDNRFAGSFVEAAKYAVKSSDYLFSDLTLSCKLVKIFTNVLFHRRLWQFGGCFYDVFKELDLQDVESDDVDLVHFNGNYNPLVRHYVEVFGWSPAGYKLVRNFIKEPELSADAVDSNKLS